MPYLTEETLDRMLQFVLAMPRSSAIVLDFFVPDELIAEEEAPMAAKVFAYAARYYAGRFDGPGAPTTLTTVAQLMLAIV